MDKNAKQAKAARAKAEEAALNRVLCWIVGGAVLEFLLLLLNRYYTNYTVSQIDLAFALRTVVKVIAVAALAGAVAAAFWWRSALRKGKGTNLPGTVCLFLAALSVSCFATWIFSSPGLHVMTIVVPGVIVLALVFYLYQREFFLVACQGALALLGVRICSKGLGGGSAAICYLYVVLAVVLILAAAFLCRKAQGEKGMVELKGKKVRLFPRDANYALLYAGAVVAVAVLLIAVVGLPAVAAYAVLVAWLLIMAVYYTVKLM